MLRRTFIRALGLLPLAGVAGCTKKQWVKPKAVPFPAQELVLNGDGEWCVDKSGGVQSVHVVAGDSICVGDLVVVRGKQHVVVRVDHAQRG